MKTNYSKTLDKLFNVNLSRGVKLGLLNSYELQRLLDFPDRKFASIHIAGTNGKGSVAIKIAQGFRHAGYRVGLYTSPHITCFRERIRVDGAMIPEDAVETHLNTLFALVEFNKIPATFFELTTFLAFLHFAQKQVDVAVLETGLGGRLDATNVIRPILSVITSIDLDHTDILGSTVEAIALEKAGIIKEKTPVIIGPHVPKEPIETAARQMQSSLFRVKESSLFYEQENQNIARAALNHSAKTFQLPPHAIEEGLKRCQPCRFEIIGGLNPIILDVAHNPNGLLNLFQMLDHYYPEKKVRILFGLSKSKDIHGCLKAIASRRTFFHIVESSNGRGAPALELMDRLIEMGIAPSHLSTHASVHAGVYDAKERASINGEILLICGTFFIMGDARRALGFDEPCDPIDFNER